MSDKNNNQTLDSGSIPVRLTNSASSPALVEIAALLYPNSTGNNSVVQLASGATFTGAIETVLSLQAAQIEIVCDTAYTIVIEQFIDLAGTQKSGSRTIVKTAGVPTNINVSLPGNYFRLKVTNNGAVPTTTLAISTTFGIMDGLDDLGNLPVSESSISGVAVITVGAPAIAVGRQFAVNCTVAGNVTVTFQDGSSYTAPVLVGLTIFPWAVSGVSAATATATYANMK